MKRNITAPLMIKLYVLLMLVLMGCSTGTPTQHRSIAVLYDRTSEDIQPPETELIQQEMGLKNNPNHAVHLRYLNLGNTQYLKVEELKLEANPSVLANEIERMAKVKTFQENVQGLLQKELAKAYTYQNSSLLAPLVETLHLLKNDQADAKRVVMYSDLEEHTDHFSIYRKADFEGLMNDPQTTAKSISEQLDLEDFTGITLRVIHYPKDMESDKRFNALLALYQAIFKNTGLTIKYNSER